MLKIRIKKLIVESLEKHTQKSMILKNQNIFKAFVDERLLEMIENGSHLPMVIEIRGDKPSHHQTDHEFH